LKACWGGPETVIIISSDLSHFHSYREAVRRDRQTAEAIEHLDLNGLGPDSACGRNGIRGLLLLAQEYALEVTRLDLRNSGDTAGPRDRVVGYGAWAFYES
jgi:AmmeMemoRadiSam system protein B